MKTTVNPYNTNNAKIDNTHNLYVLRVKGDNSETLIKLGYSNNIVARLSQYFNHNPLFELIGTYYREDAKLFERWFHSNNQSEVMNEWYNEQLLSFIITSMDSEFIANEIISKEAPKVKEEIKCIDFIRLVFDVQLTDYNGLDCVFIPEGREYYGCVIPFNNKTKKSIVTDTNKYVVIRDYINNLICLNPNISYFQTFIVVKGVEKRLKYINFEDKIIQMIIKEKINDLNNGILKPVNTKIKKFWVNPVSENKLDIYHKTKKDNSIMLLERFFGDDILNINEKVTYDTVVEYTKLSLRTVKSRLTNEMKLSIKNHNKEIKNMKLIK